MDHAAQRTDGRARRRISINVSTPSPEALRTHPPPHTPHTHPNIRHVPSGQLHSIAPTLPQGRVLVVAADPFFRLAHEPARRIQRKSNQPASQPAAEKSATLHTAMPAATAALLATVQNDHATRNANATKNLQRSSTMTPGTKSQSFGAGGARKERFLHLSAETFGAVEGKQERNVNKISLKQGALIYVCVSYVRTCCSASNLCTQRAQQLRSKDRAARASVRSTASLASNARRHRSLHTAKPRAIQCCRVRECTRTGQRK